MATPWTVQLTSEKASALDACTARRRTAHLPPLEPQNPAECCETICPLWHTCLRAPGRPVISSFRGPHAFLSNFLPIPGGLPLDGERYRTLEHAFQAVKTASLVWRERIRRAPTPEEARRVGRKVPLRKDWERVKVAVMADLVRRKFDPREHPALARMLLDTGTALLIEGNTWNDGFWGVDQETGLGLNHLGRLLMETRQALAGRDCLN